MNGSGALSVYYGALRHNVTRWPTALIRIKLERAAARRSRSTSLLENKFGAWKHVSRYDESSALHRRGFEVALKNRGCCTKGIPAVYRAMTVYIAKRCCPAHTQVLDIPFLQQDVEEAELTCILTSSTDPCFSTIGRWSLRDTSVRTCKSRRIKSPLHRPACKRIRSAMSLLRERHFSRSKCCWRKSMSAPHP